MAHGIFRVPRARCPARPFLPGVRNGRSLGGCRVATGRLAESDRRGRGNSTVADPTTPAAPKCYGFGLFRVRSPLLSESRFLSLPPGTEMVHFPGFAHSCLCIQQGVLEVCSSGFPHSEISGYNACVRLPGAYRSLPRPSSPVSAKASTVRP